MLILFFSCHTDKFYFPLLPLEAIQTLKTLWILWKQAIHLKPLTWDKIYEKKEPSAF